MQPLKVNESDFEKNSTINGTSLTEVVSMFLSLSLFLAPGVIPNAKDTLVEKTVPKNVQPDQTRQNNAQESTNAHLTIIPVSSDKGFILNKKVSKLNYSFSFSSRCNFEC